MGSGGCGKLELDLLRFWQLRRDGEIVHVAPRQQRLITVLALRGPSLRNYLAGLLWPDRPEPRALESLRVSIHLVTRQIPGILARDGSMLALDPKVQVDLYRVRALLQESAAGFGQAAAVVLALHNAELLPGWYEDWVLFEQSRLHQDRLRALTNLSRSLLSAGDAEGAAEAAAGALEMEPLYESAVRALVAAELHMGNSVSALLVYDKYASALRNEMGIMPSEGLRILIDGIQEGVAGPVPPGRHVPMGFLPLPGRQPLTHNLEDFLPVNGGNAALPGTVAVGDPGAEA